MARDDFPKTVIDGLAKRAAFICSNPDCRASTLAPSESEEGKYLYIGKAAHICAAAVGGPRYSPSMSAEERAAIVNGIFLCSSCADRIDKNTGADFPEQRLRQWKAEHEKWVSENLNKRSTGRGGDGGGGTIIGNRGTIVGGRAGDGGLTGTGGKGGSGFIQGDEGLIVGGDGGSAGTPDGRGGRGARSVFERSGDSTGLWRFGKGGSAANASEYDRRLSLLASIRREYMNSFPEEVPFIDAGVDPVPVNWVNKRLEELAENWRVEMSDGGYFLPALPA